MTASRQPIRAPGDPFSLYLGITWILSVVAHLALFAFITIFVSAAASSAPSLPKEPKPLVFKLIDLPKGPGVGTRAVRKSRQAKVNPFQKEAEKIKKKIRQSDMSKNIKKVVRSPSKRRSYNPKEALRASAMEKMKRRINEEAAEGGGGSGDRDGGSVAKKYVAAVRSKIRRNWRRPADLTTQDLERRGVVRVRIDSAGNLMAASITSSSGKKTIDSSLLSAIRSAAPFPRPPLELTSRAGGGIDFPFRAKEAK